MKLRLPRLGRGHVDPVRSEMHDRLAIQQLLAAYAHAVDRRDLGAVGDCFLPDAVARYNGVDFNGVDEILAYISGVERYPATQHVFAPADIRVNGDTATASSHAISHIVLPGENGDRLMSRGLTYHDELVRTASGWKIRRRVHQPHWGTVVDVDWGGWPPGYTGTTPLVSRTET